MGDGSSTCLYTFTVLCFTLVEYREDRMSSLYTADSRMAKCTMEKSGVEVQDEKKGKQPTKYRMAIANPFFLRSVACERTANISRSPSNRRNGNQEDSVEIA